MAPLLAVVYIAPFAKVGKLALQGGVRVRLLGIFPLLLLAGCAVWPFADASEGGEVPTEAVRMYAKAHDLTREEAQRELTMLRDADHLKELRQVPKKQDETGK